MFLVIISLLLPLLNGQQLRMHDFSMKLPKDVYKDCRQSGECYIFVNKKVPRYEAVQTCKDYNGSVVLINDPAENEWIAARLKSLKFSHSYLNAKYDKNLQIYLTSEGSMAGFVNSQPPFELLFESKSKNNHRRTKRHARVHKSSLRRVVVYKHIGKRRIVYVKYKSSKRINKVKHIYRFKYRKFLQKYENKFKQKLKLYKIIVAQKTRKIREEKLKLFQIWISRIEWLKKQNWENWFESIKEIDKTLWINRIREIIDIINKKSIDSVDFKWNAWWTKILNWYRDWIKQFSKKQIDMIWKWKQFLVWLKKNSWEKSITYISGIDQELWKARIKRIIWVIEERKYVDICDKDWSGWKTTVEAWIKMANEKRKDILDNDKKRLTIEKWKKRLDWIQQHHIDLLIKFGNASSDWKNKALAVLENVKNYIKNYDIDSLSGANLLSQWQEIKKQTEKDLTEFYLPKDVQTILGWINGFHWLESNNIQYILQHQGGPKEKTEYERFESIIKGNKYSPENFREISEIFPRLKSLIENQKSSAIKGISDISIIRKSRSVVNYFNIPINNSLHPLDLPRSIDALKDLAKNYPSLEIFLINHLTKLHYLARKFSENKFEPHQILFEKLIRDHVAILERLKLPLNFWKLLSTMDFPSLSINLKRGDCLTMENNGRTPELWQQISCNRPQQFICQIKS